MRVQDLQYILIYMAMTEERIDRLGRHQQCSCHQYAAVVPESISCFELEARTIDRYGGPTVSDVAQMSDIRLRSVMYGRICRGLGAPAASESLIANTIPPKSKHLEWSTGKSQCLTISVHQANLDKMHSGTL